MNTRQRKKKAKYWFSDKERINADITAAEFLYCLLTEFRKINKHSFPLGLTEDEWDSKLNQMIWSFGQLRKNYPAAPHPANYENVREYREAAEIYQEKINKGFEAFGKYVGELWD